MTKVMLAPKHLDRNTMNTDRLEMVLNNMDLQVQNRMKVAKPLTFISFHPGKQRILDCKFVDRNCSTKIITSDCFITFSHPIRSMDISLTEIFQVLRICLYINILLSYIQVDTAFSEKKVLELPQFVQDLPPKQFSRSLSHEALEQKVWSPRRGHKVDSYNLV
jgi:hypothetical protein